MKCLLLPLLASLALPTAVNAETYYKWHKNAMTDENYISIGLNSNEKRDVTLRVFCWPNENPKKTFFQARMDFDKTLDIDSSSVTIRWDKEKAYSEYWRKDDNNLKRLGIGQATFSVTGATRPYIRNFKKYSSLLVQYKTWPDGSPIVSFDLTQLKPLLDRAEQEGCNWEKPEKKKKQKSNSGSGNVSVNCNSPVWKNKPRCN